MKRKKSIKIWIFLSFIGATAVFLFLIWYFQIVHFEKFYMQIKKYELQKAAEETFENIDKIKYKIENIADEYNVSINIVNDSGISLYDAGVGKHSNIKINKYSDYRAFYNRVKANDDEDVIYEVEGLYRQKGSGNKPVTQDKGDKDRNHITIPKQEFIADAKCMIYAGIRQVEGKECVVLLCSMVTPVEATTDTLQIQFVIESIIFVLLAVAIAFVTSYIVSKPIIKINNSAKELPNGKYSMDFGKAGYKEVYELAGTLEYASKEVMRSKELQRDIIANVSHDLRTPLTMIRAYAEAMRDLEGENTSENAGIIVEETIRLSELVDDMLNLSKLQSGVEVLKICTFNITDSIEAIIERFSKYTKNEGYTIGFEYDERVFTEADESKICQVIYNLVINAINHAGETKKILVRQHTENKKVTISVTDYGKGIDESEIDSIWDRYYKTQKEGSGIGLSIVKNILELHSAKYGVISEVGSGSTFWFTLNYLPNEK